MSALLLLAQAVGPGVSPNDMPLGIMIVLIVAAVMAVPITGIIVGVRYATKERELQHAERLKAIEKGIDLDGVESEREEERRFRKGILRLAFAIGVVVPMFAVIGATSAVINMEPPAPNMSNNMVVFLVWTGAASIGVAAVGSGAWLAQGAIARLSPDARRGSQATSTYRGPYETPEATLAH
ncbi:MAG: hypothetical protein WD894_02575 [Pirellulales bacterium]